MSCEMQTALKRLWAHLQVIFPAMEVTYSNSSSAVENKSRCNHVLILCCNPSKQDTHKSQQPGNSSENALISPAHAGAGWDRQGSAVLREQVCQEVFLMLQLHSHCKYSART